MNQFEYKRATTAKEAVSSLSKHNSAMFLAGGTNLLDLMKKSVTAPEKLVDINALPLNKIEKTAAGLHIGALARNSDVSENDLVKQFFPLLAQALKSGASPQLRNMATVGGNMMQRTRCSYFYDTAMPCNKRNPGSGCGAIGGYNRMHAIFGASEKCIAVHPSDMCVALSALDATVLVSGPKADRKIPFADFHRLPGNNPEKDNTLQKGELITGVDIPFNNLAGHSHYMKVRDRASYAFALVSVGVALYIAGNNIIREVNISMGGVAHKPWRLKEAEQFLIGKAATEDNFNAAAALSMKDAKGQGQNNFKLKLATNTLVEALKKAAEP